MQLSSRTREWILVLVSIAIVIVVVLIAFTRPRHTPVVLERAPVSTARLPDRIPADLPIDAAASIVQNDLITSDDGRSQMTRSYVTTASFNRVTDEYAAYLAAGSWHVLDRKSLPHYAAWLAERGSVQLQITVNESTAPSHTSVNITATLTPPVVEQ